jgi:hypothetical protein
VTSGLYGLLTRRLPQRPFTMGRFSIAIFVLGVLWSVVICVTLVWQNPSQVGLGMLGAIVVGAILYGLIPSSRLNSAAAPAPDAGAAAMPQSSSGS